MSAPSCASGSVKRQGKRVGDEHDKRTGGFGRLNRRAVVSIDSLRVRPWHQQCCGVFVDRVAIDHDAKRLCTGSNDVKNLWMQRTGEGHAVPFFAVMPIGYADGFRDRGGFVEQRG